MAGRFVAVAALSLSLTVGWAFALASPGAAKSPAASQQATTAAAAAPAGSTCKVSFRDTANYRTVPLSPNQADQYVLQGLLNGYVKWDASGWPNRGSLIYHTCPPKRLLMIGDSLPFSLGIPMLEHENRYGVELANASMLGCAFTTRGQLYGRNEKWTSLPSSCPGSARHWARVVSSFHAQATIVMLGYRDEFDWRYKGQHLHLGQRAFDAYVEDQIDKFVKIVGANGQKILFMTVPYAQPRQKDGSLAPAASRTRHAIINSLIEAVARKYPGQVAVFNTDQYISPGNHYDARLNGKGCRSDGIHFTSYCALFLQPKVFHAALQLIAP